MEPGSPQVQVDDKKMPDLPQSVMNIMSNMPAPHTMSVSPESEIGESASEPTGYFVSGAKAIDLMVIR